MAIATIKTDRNVLLKRAKRDVSLSDSSNELEIFYHLCEGRVYFRKITNTLYFVESPTIPISDVICSVFKGMNLKPEIRQLYMDVHNLFNAALTIKLSPKQQKVLFVALRLRDIKVYLP